MTSPAASTFHLDTVRADRRTGADVLCIPGLFAGSWVFEGLLPMLAERGHNASAISLRGHPPLPPIRDIGSQSIGDFYSDVAAAARTLERPIVIGHSMGGLLALMLAANGLVRAAVLMSPAPSRGIPALSVAIVTRMVRYLPALLFSQPFLPVAEHFDALVLNALPPEQRAAQRARFSADSGRASRDIALGVHAIPPEQVRVPMLVVGADDDRFIPLGTSQRMAKKYGAELYVAKGHGHFLLAEPGWQQEAAVILDWIDALEENPSSSSRIRQTTINRTSPGVP
ncbi:MAG: putative Alpha/beta hydrolase fold [Gemmatimonadetes bacterium]|nr:putative Alpha/beta hydrolase fold [Gemmatimonadota bacterium]